MASSIKKQGSSSPFKDQDEKMVVYPSLARRASRARVFGLPGTDAHHYHFFIVSEQTEQASKYTRPILLVGRSSKPASQLFSNVLVCAHFGWNNDSGAGPNELALNEGLSASAEMQQKPSEHLALGARKVRYAVLIIGG
ncbi:hypothetical protein HPB51_004702 [Rhipicephalus microplus]|uniref:Uncharacterized protein n=1 Tax=Rhipicephalus microplus TaxID=6941 RepID=A0A9J6DZ28_RHIMP|nr:hypothetical protein HPB51_004702 [Rhipicephalus microplus]